MFSVFLSSIMVVAHIIQTTIYINDMTSALDEAWMIGLFMLNLLENCQIEDAFKCQKRHILFFFQCDVGICWFTFERRSHWADLEIFPLKTLTTAVQLSWLANSQLRTLHVCCILYITSYCVATRHFILYIIHDDEACQHQIYTLSHVHRYTQISWWIDAAREWAKRIGDDAHIYSKLIPNNVCRPWRGNANEDNDCCGSGVCEKDAERA